MVEIFAECGLDIGWYSKLNEIRPRTAELAALERLEKSP